MSWAAWFTAQAIRAFENATNLTRAVRAFLLVSAKNNTSIHHPSGCLLVCCATSSAEEMADVRQIIAQSFTALEERIASRFEAAVAGGELASKPSPRARARLLLDFMTGQAVRARSGAPLESLVDDIDARVKSVLVPPLKCRDVQGRA